MKVLLAAGAMAVLAAACSPAASWHASWHSGWAKPGMTGEAFKQAPASLRPPDGPLATSRPIAR